MVVGVLSERDTCVFGFLRYYSIVLELASHIFLQVSLVRLSVQWLISLLTLAGGASHAPTGSSLC